MAAWGPRQKKIQVGGGVAPVILTTCRRWRDRTILLSFESRAADKRRKFERNLNTFQPVEGAGDHLDAKPYRRQRQSFGRPPSFRRAPPETSPPRALFPPLRHHKTPSYHTTGSYVSSVLTSAAGPGPHPDRSPTPRRQGGGRRAVLRRWHEQYGPRASAPARWAILSLGPPPGSARHRGKQKLLAFDSSAAVKPHRRKKKTQKNVGNLNRERSGTKRGSADTLTAATCLSGVHLWGPPGGRHPSGNSSLFAAQAAPSGPPAPCPPQSVMPIALKRLFRAV